MDCHPLLAPCPRATEIRCPQSLARVLPRRRQRRRRCQRAATAVERSRKTASLSCVAFARPAKKYGEPTDHAFDECGRVSYVRTRKDCGRERQIHKEQNP